MRRVACRRNRDRASLRRVRQGARGDRHAVGRLCHDVSATELGRELLRRNRGFGGRHFRLTPRARKKRSLRVKITEVEAIILRQPIVDGAIADGSQDDLIVRVHTDDGIVGIGEVDSAPEVAKAVYDAPNSHYIATGLRHVLIGHDPLDIEGAWRRMYMGSVYYGRRGVAMHAMSGIDIALWDIKGKKLGKPVCELLGRKKHDRVRAYA